MKLQTRIPALILSLGVALSGCGGHGNDKDSPAPAAETPNGETHQPEATDSQTPVTGDESTGREPGEDDQFPWWMLIGLGAARPSETIEEVQNLCGKFFDFDGEIKLVQTRTRGQRTYKVLFLDPKYKMETHYCFEGRFRRWKVLGGRDFTVFEITGWARTFLNHANARKADNLPPLPRTPRPDCSRELTTAI